MNFDELKTFKKCPRKYFYLKQQPRPSLDHGTVSAVVSSLGRIAMHEHYISQDLKLTSETITRAAKSMKGIDPDILLESEILTKQIVLRYNNYYKDDFNILENQNQLQVKIGSTKEKYNICCDLKVFNSSKVYLVMHKFVDRCIDYSDIINDEAVSLAWAYLKATDIMPKGVVINQIRTSLPQEPRVLKNKNLSRAISNTDYDTYLKTLRRLGFKEKHYMQELIRLSANEHPYFKRDYIDISQKQIEIFEKELLAINYHIIKNLLIYYANPQTDCVSTCQYFAECKGD